MKKLSIWISKVNSKNSIIIFLIISLIAYVAMGTSLFGMIHGFGTDSMLDSTFFYTGSEFMSQLENLTQNEVSAYLYIHLVDYLFIISFYPALTFIYKKTLRTQSGIFILPILAMLCDFVENIIIDIKLISDVPNILGSISGILTTLKFAFILITIILVIINVIQNRRNNE